MNVVPKLNDTSMKLSAGNLIRLHDSIQKPAYPLTDVTCGVIHLGVGGFHRSHQCVYFDRLLEKNLKWGVCGVGLMPGDQKMAEALKAQDHLFTVIEKDGDQRVVSVIGSLRDYIFAPADKSDVINRIASPEIQILSLTVTERGYYHNTASGLLNEEHSDIRHDLAAGADLKTAVGTIVEGLHARQKAGGGPLTLLSCDNLPANGKILKNVVTAFAGKKYPALLAWIEENCTFPCTMVDRITPVTRDEDRDFLLGTYNLADQWPVPCEAFMQWIVEDDFAGERPDLASVGVQFVDNVYPYELAKIRLLNVTHSLMCYPGYLMGHRFVHQAAQDSLVSAYMSKVMTEEIIPTLTPPTGMDLQDYANSIVARFANPAIEDTLARICMDGSQKLSNQLMPIIREQLAAGRSIRLLAFALAVWIRYLTGTDELGGEIQIQDPQAERLNQVALRSQEDVREFLGMEDIFGADLARDARLYNEVQNQLRAIKEQGMAQALSALLKA